eukprot:4665105-Pyramimonas_sp.AAC.1
MLCYAMLCHPALCYVMICYDMRCDAAHASAAAAVRVHVPEPTGSAHPRDGAGRPGARPHGGRP